MNHSTRSLPWMIGRMYSSVVGQNRLALHTEVTDGFQVTSERDRYLNRLKACSSFSKPGSALISGSSWLHIGEGAIDREAVGVVAQRRIVLQPGHALGRHAEALDRRQVVAVLLAEGGSCTGLGRRGERVETLVDPVARGSP